MKSIPKRFWLLLFLQTVVLLYTSKPTTVLARSLLQDDPTTQCQEGVQLYYDGKVSEALPLLEAAFVNRDSTTFANIDELGVCALALGRLYQSLGSISKALEAELVALNIFRRSHNQYYVSITLQDIGIAYRVQGRYVEALENYQEALAISREIGDRGGEGAALANIAVVYLSQGKNTEALDNLQQALAIAREEGKQQGESYILSSIASVFDSQGRYDDALEYYRQALTISLELGDRRGEGVIRDNIGSVLRHQGKTAEALENYQQALAIVHEVADRSGEGIVLNNIALVYDSQGRYAEALENYQRSLAIAREVGDPSSESATLNNMGLIYRAEGQGDKALENYELALKIYREIGDKLGEAIVLSNIASLYIWQQRYEEALENYQRALDIYRQSGSRNEEGTILNGIGLLFEQQGQYTEALDSYQQALEIAREVGDQWGEITTLGQIGTIYQGWKKYSEALDAYQQTLILARGLGDRTSEARMLSNIGAVYEDQGRFVEALDVYEQAITVHEGIRVTAGTESARASYIAQFAFIYDRVVNLYFQQAQPEKAFFTAERGRARAFLDSVTTGFVDLSDKENVTLLNQESEAYAKRQAARNALIKARTQSPSDAELIADLEMQLAQAEKDYEAALVAIAGGSSQLEQLVPGRSTVLDVSQVQALLDDKTTVISFWVLDDLILGFVVDRVNFNAVPLRISINDLSTLIDDFRNFSNTQEAYPDNMIKLYSALIIPLRPYLKTPYLAIIPHSILNYLPFAALTDGQRYLMDDHVITYLPSASTLPFVQQNAQETDGQSLIIGNPITGDYGTTASLATERDQLGPLPFAEEEAKAIAEQLGAQPYLETHATETLVKQQASQTQILHLAAHGVFNPVAPLSSLIALTPDQENDGWLTVSEVYGLDLHNADLVVLSACDTQIGGLTAGDEFVGLTRAFFFAGTPTVVASLWSVDDQATAILMERFYTHLQEGMGKAEALKQAQVDVRGKFPNPYYWAAFTLSGDSGAVGGMKPAKSLPVSIPCVSTAGLVFVVLAIQRKRLAK